MEWCGGDPLSIRGKACCPQRTGTPLQWLDGHSGIFQVPDLGRLVEADGDKPLAIGRKTHSCDRPLMTLDRHERLAPRVQLLDVCANLDDSVGIGRSQLDAVAEEDHGRYGRSMSALMRCNLAACGCVVNEQRTRKPRADGDPLAIRTQGRGTQRESTGAKILCQPCH